ncbi:MAG: DUF2950 domain-containing protein [Verrucomicrobiia bacterium]
MKTKFLSMAALERCLRSVVQHPVLWALALSAPLTASAAEYGKAFATPEQAVSALAAAARTQDTNALRGIFGPAVADLENPDRVQAAHDLTVFTAAFDQTRRVVRESDSRCTLEVGERFWPFPVPLVKKGGQWFFDTEAGKEELLNRRIGGNELNALQAVRAYVAAQREYVEQDRDGDAVLEYAQKFISSPGTKDGLYWPPEFKGDISPLGPLVARAQGQGYTAQSREKEDAPVPFHGYYFTILTGQGQHAPGGRYHYVINGNMIGGFALVAWPADYGNSGIMTFMVNQQGRVYQNDLGPRTARIVGKIEAYDPDQTWSVSPD